jgi:hypothetical protein
MGLTITSNHFATNCCHRCRGGGVACCMYSNEHSFLVHLEKGQDHVTNGTNKIDMVLRQVSCPVILLVMILILMVSFITTGINLFAECRKHSAKP